MQSPGNGGTCSWFHVSRHTIASKLDEVGVSASAIAAITGHRTGQNVLEKLYIDRKSLPDRVATLAKLSVPAELTCCQSGQFESNHKQAK